MKKLMLLGGIMIVVAAIAGSGCGQSNANAEGASAAAVNAVTVRIQELRPTLFTDAISATGTIQANEDVMLSPEEGGVVKEWLVEKGQRVRKGQVIGVLSDDVIKASYDAAQAQYKMSELNFEKQKSVYEQKAISELQYKSLQYTRDAAKAQADLMFARLERTRLRSPIDGVLDDRMKNEGEFAPPMVPVAHVVNLKSIKVVADVSERFAGEAKVGDVAKVIVDAFPNDTLTGRVQYVGAAVSSSNRTIPVEIAIRNPDLKLKPEMIARVRIIRSVRENALLIDENVAQLVDRDKRIVYVENDGKAEQRVVTIGGRRGEKIEIVDGLRAGDHIIVAGYQKLSDGQPVQIAGS